MDNDMVKIEINEEEVKQFICFHKHYESIAILIESGFFEVKNGRAIVDFSHESRIMCVDLSTRLYKRAKKKTEDLTVNNSMG